MMQILPLFVVIAKKPAEIPVSTDSDLSYLCSKENRLFRFFAIVVDLQNIVFRFALVNASNVIISYIPQNFRNSRFAIEKLAFVPFATHYRALDINRSKSTNCEALRHDSCNLF
jgi:hypothetical protein